MNDTLTLDELRALPATIDLPTAARALGLGRTKAYELAKTRSVSLPVLRIGSTYRIPTAELLHCLGWIQGLRQGQGLVITFFMRHELARRAGRGSGPAAGRLGRQLTAVGSVAATFFTESAIFIATVKQGDLVKITGPLEAEALRILREVPGLTVIAEPAGADREVDAVLEFPGSQVRVAVQVKTRASAATAWQLVYQAERNRDVPLLLIAGETTARAREIMAEHGIAVIDGLGNAHIELPGLLIHMEARRPHHQGRPARLAGKAGVIAQALLLHPERGWQVQDLAQEAGSSLGLTHRVLTRLADEGLLATEGAGPQRVRRVTHPAALLDLWAEETADRPDRTPAYLLAQSPRQLITELGSSLDRSGVDYALTGAAAGSLVAPFTTAVPVAEVWVTATTASEQLYDAAGADAVSDGHNVVFLQAKDDSPLAFREQASGLWLANRFRIYSDLRRDPRRGREQADHLRKELIGF